MTDLLTSIPTDEVTDRVPLPEVSPTPGGSQATGIMGRRADDRHQLRRGVLSLDGRDWHRPTPRNRPRLAYLRTFTDQECLTYRIDPCPSLEELRGG